MELIVGIVLILLIYLLYLKNTHKTEKSNETYINASYQDVQTEKENREVVLKPRDTPEMVVPYKKGMLIYSYCNKHGLWKKEVD